MYVCTICDYRTKLLYNFNRHKNRKIPCKKKNTKPCTIIGNAHQFTQKLLDSSNVVGDSSNVVVSSSNVVGDDKCSVKCSKCYKIFSSIYSMNNHLKKCQSVHSLQCFKCKKVFSSRFGKYYHLKNVTCVPVDEVDDAQCIINNTHHNNNYIDSSVHNTILTVNSTTFNNVQINAFGSENISYLVDENMRLKNILQKKDAFMQKIVEAIHFDENHPENHNIMMTNLQSKHIMIHNGTKFVKALKEPTFHKLIQNKRNIINGNIEDLGLSIACEKYIKDKLDMLRHDEDKQKILKEKLELLCYNNKDTTTDIV